MQPENATSVGSSVSDGRFDMTKELTLEDLKDLDIRGLCNDARYWDLRRTYGDNSEEVRRHLISCARYQGLIRFLTLAKRLDYSASGTGPDDSSPYSDD
jgi:hypothetical protein